MFILSSQDSGEAGPFGDFDGHDQCVVLRSKPDQPSAMFFEFSPGRIIFIAVHTDQSSHQESQHDLGGNHEKKHGVAEFNIDELKDEDAVISIRPEIASLVYDSAVAAAVASIQQSSDNPQDATEPPAGVDDMEMDVAG